jgi:hypothetical protein
MFDEGSGQTAADSSGNSRDGTIGSTTSVESSDPTWVCVMGGNALDFDGSDDQVLVGDYDVLNAISISAWINWDAITIKDGILSKRTDPENAGNWVLRLDGRSASGLLEWMVWTGFDASQKFYSVSAISTGVWTHVVLTFDDPSDTAKFYIDGGLDNTSTSFTNSLADTAEPIIIGWAGQSGSEHFDGRIDDVRIYDRVLSPAEISALAASPPTDCGATPTPTSTPPTPTNTPTPTATSAGGPPSLDSQSTGDTGATSMTISHTTSGSNRLMLVGITIYNQGSETVSSVTYNGAALSPVGSVQRLTESRVEIWSLVAPATGTHDVVITFNAQLSNNATAGAITFTGVDQGTPLGTFASASGDSAGPATVNVSSAANELVFDTVACRQCGGLTPDISQSPRWNQVISSGLHRGRASTAPGASSVTMSWTMGASRPWAIGAVPIKPSGGSPPSVDGAAADTTAPDTLIVSHTTSGSERLMLVGISFDPNNDQVVSSVTYNGTALSKEGHAVWSNDARAEIWSLVAPALGTHDVAITFSARLSFGAAAGVQTFNGVDQVTPLGTFVPASGSSAGPATVDVSSGANQLVFDTVACETCTSLTLGASQTQLWNLSHAGGYAMGAASTEPGAATVTMSWTLGSSDHWAIGAVPINPP